MNDQASLEIRQAFSRSIPQQLSGMYSGSVLLTPPSVKRVTSGTWPHRIFFGTWLNWKPGPLVPRYEFRIDPSSGSTAMHTVSWTDGKVTGIYQGGARFPEFCCKCMNPVTRYDLVELRTSRRWVRRFEAWGIVDEEKVKLIAEALAYARFWYALPFCQEHGLESKALDFEERDQDLILGFTNQEYGRLFGEFNRLEGRWMNQSKLLARMLSYVAALAGIGLTVIGLIAGTSGNLPSGLILLLAGIGFIGMWFALASLVEGRHR